MPPSPSGRRRAPRSQSQKTIAKTRASNRTPTKTRHCPRSASSASSNSATRHRHVAPPPHKPIAPTVVYADRLIPFRPRGTLSEAAEKQKALEKMRGMTLETSASSGSERYRAILQGEVLGAKLEIQREQTGRAALRAIPDRWYLNFSAEVKPKGILAGVGRYPFEYGPARFLLENNRDVYLNSRVLQKQPYKILDAPNLGEDFYYNLIDWSSSNILAVGLANAVYMYKAATSTVEDFDDGNALREEITAVCWSRSASVLAVGSRGGHVQLFNPETKRLVTTLCAHAIRIGCMSWSTDDTLAIGCRDGLIRFHDNRQRRTIFTVSGHTSEVCGVQWSRDRFHLASGGNDNRVFVWDLRNRNEELWKITDHSAAVKALSWSPHNRKMFASGGGMKDLTIKTWNLDSMTCVRSANSEAQVCGIHWSENVDEIVSIHGFHNSEIKVWKAKSLECMGLVAKQNSRIIYMTPSPDGRCIATGSGDERIRFFEVFPPAVDGERFFGIRGAKKRTMAR